jgi:two-component system, cell cycle sensor histidine kinase and response regulator CckA
MSTARTPADETAMIKRMRQHRLKGLAEMAAGMAHEISQPLGGIRGFAEGILIGLEEGWDISEEEIITKMRRIIAEADRIDELIQSVRRFADDGGRLDLVAVDALTAVQAAVRLMGTRLQANGIELEVTARGLSTRVRANPFGLQEVVQILLANAGDACAAPGDSAVRRIGILVDGGVAATDPVVITVADSGIGMDEATLAQAGEPFFTTKGPDRGVGLGLASARGLLAQCGGQLALASSQTGGTTVTVRLWQRIEEGA